jgi:hypothetical protein
VINCILKLTHTGGQWRNIDSGFGLPWEIVCYYFSKMVKTKVFYKILSYLVASQRAKEGREKEASRCAVDSQSVKKGSFVSIETGIDGNKKIMGRKRHIAVDVLGSPSGLTLSYLCWKSQCL